MQQRIDSSGGRSVGLDMRHVDPALFPNVVGALKRAGIDPEHELIPVAPAAHYMMGGIATDSHGRASVAGPLRGRRVLLHGPARRQPAGVQLAERVLRVRRPRGARRRSTTPRRPAGRGPVADDAPLPKPTLSAASRAALWQHAGLERTPTGCARCSRRTPAGPADRRAALTRQESRGAHQRTDFPALDPAMDRAT